MTAGIKNKIVVVTGASSGLGEATARLLSAEGATVVLGARRADRLWTLAKELETRGGNGLAVTTDVSQRDQVKALVDAAVQTYGRVDVMINNAGLMPQAPRAAEGRRVKPDDRCQHKGRAVRHRRGAAAHAAPEVRPLHQRLVRRRSQGRPRLRSSDPDASKRIRTFYDQVAVPADSFAASGCVRDEPARGGRHQRDPVPADQAGNLRHACRQRPCKDRSQTLA
jgi:hypothetical protein